MEYRNDEDTLYHLQPTLQLFKRYVQTLQAETSVDKALIY